MRRDTHPQLVAVLMAMVVAVAGCSSLITGHAVKAPPQLNADGVEEAQLSPGNYPTKAVPPAGPTGQPPGIILEGQRMAGNVVGPWEVDASLTNLGAFNTKPMIRASALTVDFGDARAKVAEARGFIVGFSTSRSTEGPPPSTKSLVNLVMRFPDPAAAAAAAGEMTAADPLQQPDQPPRRPIPIPRYADAAGSAFDRQGGGVVVESFRAHGIYVLYQWAETSDAPEVATELIGKTLDLQIPLIDKFAPTDVAQLASLPVDPTGLLAHALPQGGDAATTSVGVYSPQATLHFESNPDASAKLFKDTGVEAFAMRKTAVYQARDANGATQVRDAKVAEDVGTAKPMAGPAGLATAKCFDRGADVPMTQFRYECFARAGRYAFIAVSQQPQDVLQQAAAQYLMLSQW